MAPEILYLHTPISIYPLPVRKISLHPESSREGLIGDSKWGGGCGGGRWYSVSMMFNDLPLDHAKVNNYVDCLIAEHATTSDIWISAQSISAELEKPHHVNLLKPWSLYTERVGGRVSRCSATFQLVPASKGA